MSPPVRWKSFGWQGITLSVPHDWDLAGFEGNRRAGRFWMDDEAGLRLHARWQQDGRRGSFDRVARRVAARMRRDARRRGTSLSEKPGAVALPGAETRLFREQGDDPAWHLLTRCRHCHRVLLLSAPAARSASLDAVRRRLFLSVGDHSGDGTDYWSAYGLRCVSPAGSRLETADLETGRIRLSFVRRRQRLVAVRLGPASLMLPRKPLPEWMAEAFDEVKESSGFSGNTREHLGHAGYEGRGVSRRRTFLLDVWPRRCEVIGRLWHCEASDRILGACLLSPRPAQDLLDRFARSFLCHGDRLPDETASEHDEREKQTAATPTPDA